MQKILFFKLENDKLKKTTDLNEKSKIFSCFAKYLQLFLLLNGHFKED